MDAQIGAWEPPAKLAEDHVRALDDSVRSMATGGDALHPGDDDAARLREVVNAQPDARASVFAERPSDQLVGWLRVLTLAEEAVPGCTAGAKSPVIDIARLLRERGDYPPALTAWIRSVSNNRFLPYGSLMDRLKG